MSEFEDKLQSILGDPDAMGQIMSIARSLTGDAQDAQSEAPAEDAPPAPDAPVPAPSSLLGDLDPRLVQLGMRLMAEYNSSDDRKTALLTALRPFVQEKRYAKVDKAVQIAKLAHVIRVALDTFRKGDADLV